MPRQSRKRRSRRRSRRKTMGGEMLHQLSEDLADLGSFYQTVRDRHRSNEPKTPPTEADFHKLHALATKIYANPQAPLSWKKDAADTQRVAIGHMLSFRR